MLSHFKHFIRARHVQNIHFKYPEWPRWNRKCPWHVRDCTPNPRMQCKLSSASAQEQFQTQNAKKVNTVTQSISQLSGVLKRSL